MENGRRSQQQTDYDDPRWILQGPVERGFGEWSSRVTEYQAALAEKRAKENQEIVVFDANEARRMRLVDATSSNRNEILDRELVALQLAKTVGEGKGLAGQDRRLWHQDETFQTMEAILRDISLYGNNVIDAQNNGVTINTLPERSSTKGVSARYYTARNGFVVIFGVSTIQPPESEQPEKVVTNPIAMKARQFREAFDDGKIRLKR